MSEPLASRAADIEEWETVQKGLEEALALAEASPDEENLALCTDFEAQLTDCVQRLNNSERLLNINPTPNVKFIECGTTTNPQTSCVYNDAAPHQVLFDGKKWYSAIIVSKIEPSDRLERVRYRVWILGYNKEETVLAEELRKWRVDLNEPLAAGQKCFAIYPATGRFREAIVDKVTPRNTVVVKFGVLPMESATLPEVAHEAPAFDEKEIPMSHILNGKWYPEIKKVTKLSTEEKMEKQLEKKTRKRERESERRQTKREEAFRRMAENLDVLDGLF